MTKRNPNMGRLKASYLFPEINARKRAFLAKNPGADLISLGIGDTTEPIPQSVADALAEKSMALATAAGYSGYGAEQGEERLREQIARRLYGGKLKAEELFISDGAKCDIGRLQSLFGSAPSIALQDPVYPVYLEGSLIHGVQEIVSMACTPENGFFPDLSKTPRTDLIYFCSPNNPTGAVATRSQLEELVEFARANRSIILFDAAYANYIQEAGVPRSIYEIEGAKEVAIEVNSFSKLASFTGIRLGWTVVPEALKYECGGSVRADWHRLTSTLFNGASNIAQQGGWALLEEGSLREVERLSRFYMENAQIIRSALIGLGYEVYGGINAPYLWVWMKGESSWGAFERFLEEDHIVTTPGVGFGSSGEGFLRFTAFGHRQQILEAVGRIKGKFS